MLRVMSLLKLLLRTVAGRVEKAVVKSVLVDADEKVDARRKNECLAMVVSRESFARVIMNKARIKEVMKASIVIFVIPWYDTIPIHWKSATNNVTEC